jgi:hypothetical protein
MPAEADTQDAGSSRNGYFVLQASAEQRGDRPAITGVLENLSTGERQEFGSATEIAQLIEAWGVGSGTPREGGAGGGAPRGEGSAEPVEQ